MGELIRYWIEEGDTTTANGVIKATGTHFMNIGKKAGLEGDEIYCPACKSVGVIQCIPPFRNFIINTEKPPKKISLSGDLCICNCPTPPRLVSVHKSGCTSHFGTSELPAIAADPESIGWLIHAGHNLVDLGLGFDQHFVITDEATEEPLAGVAYQLVLNGKTVRGITDDQGRTSLLYADTEGADISVYLEGAA